MSGTRGEVLARSIVAKLDTHQQLSEETLRRLVGLVSEVTINIDAGIDRGLVELEQEVSVRCLADSTRQAEGFSLGACWAALEVLRAVSELVAESAVLSQCVEILRRHQRLFQTVGERPGITQGELASALGEKKSNFSQKLARLNKYQMLYVCVVGRSKHLYLTRRGEDALRRVLADMEKPEAGEPMSNVIVRTIDATQPAFDEEGCTDSSRRELHEFMTKNENTVGRNTSHGERKRSVRPAVLWLLEYRASAQAGEWLSNWSERGNEYLCTTTS